MRNWLINGQAASLRNVNTTTGTPSNKRNCFGTSAPMRVPSPAAGNMATIEDIAGAPKPGQAAEKAKRLHFSVFLEPIAPKPFNSQDGLSLTRIRYHHAG